MERKVNGFSIRTAASEWDVYFDTALVMLDEIMRNNVAGRPSVLIVPVGPTEQYPILARLVNRLNVSLHDVWFFNMDEYMVSDKECIAADHPLSFRRRMRDSFYSQVDPALVMPESQRLFPEPGREAEYDETLARLGGAGLCVGGLGINGHIAFNEAAEKDDPVTADEFAGRGTRVLPVSRETRAINANGYLRGDLAGMPGWCITVGMKQILASKRIYLALNRPWQHGIFRRVLTEKPQAQIPATLLKKHADVTVCLTEEIAAGL